MKRREAVPTARAAEYLQCSTKHVVNLFYRGDVQGYFKGIRGLMIYTDSLEAWKNASYERLSE